PIKYGLIFSRFINKYKGSLSEEEVKKWRKEFIEGGVENDIPKKTVRAIWDTIIDKFKGYAFNKGHAISYSLLSYQTAYLKAHFPLEFLTARLMFEVESNALKSKDNIVKIKNEIRSKHIKIIPPNINQSTKTYSIINDQTLMTGFDALKYMSNEKSIDEILNNRPFKSFGDFLLKIISKNLRANAIQSLVASGALDEFGLTRKQMFLYCSDFNKKIKIWKTRRPGEDFVYPWPEEDVGEWTLSEKYGLIFSRFINKYKGENRILIVIYHHPIEKL
ncbi:unnamed protein product, partial [marine sediment metagenome]